MSPRSPFFEFRFQRDGAGNHVVKLEVFSESGAMEVLGSKGRRDWHRFADPCRLYD